MKNVVMLECCCGPPYCERKHLQGRRFITKVEKVEKVKNYTEELGKELCALEERIEELQSARKGISR